MLRHGGGNAQEKIQIEIRGGMVRGISMPIAAMKKAPIVLSRCAAAQMAKTHSGFDYLAPFSQNILAFFTLQRCQKFGKITITWVVPMELHATAQHEAGLRQLFCLFGRRVQNVRRGGLDAAL